MYAIRSYYARIHLADREILLVGTAHVSRESVAEVERVIREEQPDRVCVEIDASRYKNLTEGQNWSSLNISQVLKKGQGFRITSYNVCYTKLLRTENSKYIYKDVMITLGLDEFS